MRVLDILVATLVLFPWLVDGLGFEVPHFHFVALPDLGMPILVASFVAAAVRGWSGEPWEFFARYGRAMPNATAGLAALFLAAVLWRYWATDSLDIGGALWTLTHGAGGAMVVAVVALAARPWSYEPWENSFLFRQATKLAQAWLGALERSPTIALWSTASLVGTLLLWVSLLRHWSLESHGFDLGIFTNAMWNLTHGNGYVSSVKGGINLFSDHQSPLFWILAPLFWAVPRPETLLAAQAFGLAAGGPALFYLGRAHFGREHWASAALPWLYWSYLPLRNANAFEFHPEVFMLPLFLWAFVGFVSEQRWAKGLGLLALIGALGAKESAPVVAVGLGISWALTSSGVSSRSRLPGIALAAAGFVVFFLDIKVAAQIFGSDYAYMHLYDRFGGGIADVLLAPFTEPVYFFSQLINHDRLNFLFWTLAPLGFLPLFDWRAALAAVPPYLMLFLSEGNQRVQVAFHYGIEPGSALFWALPLGLAAFARYFGWKLAGIWMLFWAVACLGPNELTRLFINSPSAHARWVAAEALPCLNTDAAIAASDALMPHLATRSWISYPHQLQQRPSGAPVRCVVTDLSIGSNWPLGRSGVMTVVEGLRDQDYHESYSCRDFRVFELGMSRCLRCLPNCY